jgi:hypothetical protein
MARKYAKKAKSTSSIATKANGKKKLTARQRSNLMKRIWARKKQAKALKAEEESLSNAPTARKARTENDGPLHESLMTQAFNRQSQALSSPDNGQLEPVGERRYSLAEGNTIIDFSNGPLTFANMVSRMKSIFEANPLTNVLILEVATISFQRVHTMKIAQPDGKEEKLTLTK